VRRGCGVGRLWGPYSLALKAAGGGEVGKRMRMMGARQGREGIENTPKGNIDEWIHSHDQNQRLHPTGHMMVHESPPRYIIERCILLPIEPPE